MFSYKVKNQGNIKIFVSPDEKNENQLTVLSIYCENEKKNNRLIIPVINIETIEFVNMGRYVNFFEDCYNCFTVENSGINHFSKIENCENSVENLVYFKCKNVYEFENIDENSFFGIERHMKKFLINFYKKFENIGFLIVNINEGNNYPIIAYKTKISNNRIFLPITQDNHMIYVVNTVYEDTNQWIWKSINYNKDREDNFIDRNLINFNFPNYINNFIFYWKNYYFKDKIDNYYFKYIV